MKLIETINNTALAVAAVPEALHEARWMMHELAERDGMPARLQRLIEGAQKKDKRIAELESEVRKLTEANHGAASELNRARADAASMRMEVERLQSDVARLSAPAVAETAIPEPEVGDGWELCSSEDACEVIRGFRYSNGEFRWGEWRYHNNRPHSATRFRRPITKPIEPPTQLPSPGDGFELCEYSNATRFISRSSGESWPSYGWADFGSGFIMHANLDYAFSRPVTKPETKWLACTAEEARANPDVSEWRTCYVGIWTTCAGQKNLLSEFHYRTTAPLPLEIAVPKSVWDRAPTNARTAEHSGELKLRRDALPDGFRLDAP